MEGFLRVILLGTAAIIIIFIVCEALLTRRRKYKLANLSENFVSPIQIDSEDAVVHDPREPKIGAEEAHDYYVAERANTLQKPTRVNSYPSEDDEEVMVVTRPAVQPKPAQPQAPGYSNDLLVLSVVAKPGQQFGSYDLLQSIYATGMEFGDMNIFHYFSPEATQKVALFSLASATEPGEFDLDRIGNYFCAGLTLFSQLENVPDATKAFSLMLQAAEQLAEDLNGELRAGPHKPWNETVYQEYQKKALYFQLKKRA